MRTPQFFFAKFRKKYARNIRVYTVVTAARCSNGSWVKFNECLDQVYVGIEGLVGMLLQIGDGYGQGCTHKVYV